MGWWEIRYVEDRIICIVMASCRNPPYIRNGVPLNGRNNQTALKYLRAMVSRNSHTAISEGYSETRKLDVLEVRTLTFDLADVLNCWLANVASREADQQIGTDKY
jgi:hypothetical protein